MVVPPGVALEGSLQVLTAGARVGLRESGDTAVAARDQAVGLGVLGRGQAVLDAPRPAGLVRRRGLWPSRQPGEPLALEQARQAGAGGPFRDDSRVTASRSSRGHHRVWRRAMTTASWAGRSIVGRR